QAHRAALGGRLACDLRAFGSAAREGRGAGASEIIVLPIPDHVMRDPHCPPRRGQSSDGHPLSYARMIFLLFCLIASLAQPAFAEADDRPLLKLLRCCLDISSLFQLS